MTAAIVWPSIVVWYAVGLRIMRGIFRRAMVRGIAKEQEQNSYRGITVAEARREWMSMDGGMLLVGCFAVATIWPVALLFGWAARPFLAPIPAERAERIAALEREAGIR